MANPKRRMSQSRSIKRRTHQALSRIQPVSCSHCHESKRPHTICPACGYYGDKEVVHVEIV